MASPPNKYGVANRLLLLENAVTELRKENKELRTHMVGALHTAINDAKNVIQDSIRVPVDGAPGRDGKDGGTGPQGPPGDVLYIGPDEVAAEVKALRRKLLELRTAFLARITQHIEELKKPEHQNSTYRIIGMHLSGIKKDIEDLR
jgi:hypothetical protein